MKKFMLFAFLFSSSLINAIKINNVSKVSINLRVKDLEVGDTEYFDILPGKSKDIIMANDEWHYVDIDVRKS